MIVPTVKKEYREDLGERDADGYYDYEYRYWAYSFNLDGRNYGATVYTHTPKEAYVNGMDGTRHPEHEDDLRIVGAYLRDEAGIRTIRTLGGRKGGYGRKLRTRRL
jgi:hypothetical protein